MPERKRIYDFTRKNVLIVGGGGREQAVAQEYAKLGYIPKIMIAQGNAGTELIPHDKDHEILNVDLPHNDVADIVDIAKRENVSVAFIGSEEWLKQGIGDILQKEGIPAIAPPIDRAILELDKTYTREMCSQWGVPQPKYAYFSDTMEALAFVTGYNLQEGVVKVAGPALGKGVTVCSSQEELFDAIKTAKESFGSAADRILIEEKLVGREVSYIGLSDGETFVPFTPALDYKLLNGKNTGGMGAIAPNPFVTPEISKRIEKEIIMPIINGMRGIGKDYVGVLYGGVMLTQSGPKLIEINARMGDPETQVQLPLLKQGLPALFQTIVSNGDLKFDRKHGISIGVNEGASVLAILASNGYPATSHKGDIVYGLEKLPSGIEVVHSGTKRDAKGNIVTNGGRVLGVRATEISTAFTADENGLENLIGRVYEAIGENGIHFDGMQMREDIGKTTEVKANKKLRYDSVVNYDPVDQLKRLASQRASTTDEVAKHFGFSTIPESRGESAFLVNMGAFTGAFVSEGLGTKGLIMRHLEKREPPGKIIYPDRGSWGYAKDMTRPDSFWEALTWDTVAAIANDLGAVGAEPVVICPHWAAGDSGFFNDQMRNTDLYSGWAKACDFIGAIYGPGETSILNGVVNPDTIELSGSGFGVIRLPHKPTIGKYLAVGNRIVFIQSGGIHANGLSLARKIATEMLPNGFDELMPNGESFGEAILKPTIMYTRLQNELFKQGAEINYAVNMTGHGFRKIMRAKTPFTYRINTIPNPQEEFTFMQQMGQISTQEMYATFNMGVGYAFIVPEDHAKGVVGVANEMGLEAWDSGVLEKGPKKVIIEPNGIVFEEDSLKIR